MYNGRRIIVSLTSWPPRLCNLIECLSTILDQTLMPDKVELNLSLEEFPGREKDLPGELNEFFGQHVDIIEINWVERNTGVFKKIIPTLQKFYGEKYYLMSIDDDKKYRNDYIEMMCKYIEECDCDTFCLSVVKLIGNRMIYKSEIFDEDLWKKLTDEVISCRIDDAYIERFLTKKGAKMCNHSPSDVRRIINGFNPVSPNSHNEFTHRYSGEDIRRANQAINKIKF